MKIDVYIFWLTTYLHCIELATLATIYRVVWILNDWLFGAFQGQDHGSTWVVLIHVVAWAYDSREDGRLGLYWRATKFTLSLWPEESSWAWERWCSFVWVWSNWSTWWMKSSTTSTLACSGWSWSTWVSSRLAECSLLLVLDDIRVSRLSLVDDEWLSVIRDHLLSIVLINNCLILW